MRYEYIEKSFRPQTLELIEQANAIIEEYDRAGYHLSLRQLFYQFVSRDLLGNTQRNYKMLGSVVSDGRLAGLIDWDAIEDRGRETDRATCNFWSSPREVLEAVAEQFKIDRWLPQPNHVEVMVEKQALEGVLVPVCADLGVRFTANKGYSSQSFMRAKGVELERWRRCRRPNGYGKAIHVIYLGDHDPSGLDMDRDVRERLELFSEGRVHVVRLALTRDQIDHWNPPPNPAKFTDSRAESYVAEHGDESWELDAVEPRELDRLVRQAVAELRDEDLWQRECERQDRMRRDLERMADTYEDPEDDEEGETLE